MPVIDVGMPGKPKYLPVEVCTIEPGEAHFGKLSSNATANMLKLANRRPAVNAHHIVYQGFPQKLSLGGTPLLDAFGVKVSGDMAVVPARELPPPGFTYSQGRAQVQNGTTSYRSTCFFNLILPFRFMEY